MACDLTVIIAHVDRGAQLRSCLAALDRACARLQTELVVVQSDAVPAEPIDQPGRAVTTIRVSGQPLVPQLWRLGLAAARGRHVAFTIANCEMSAEWADALVEALKEGASGVGGPIACAVNVSYTDRAIYYLRYSAFLPSRVFTGPVPGEIAGDNAAYVASAFDCRRDVIGDGFWEVLFHRALRADGGHLAMRHDAVAQFHGGVRLTDAVRHRFAHGRHFGAWRVGDGQRRAWQIVAGAPAVPFVLALRTGRRVIGSARDRWRFVTTLPIFLLIASTWALGEAVGAVAGAGLPDVRASNDRGLGDADASQPHPAALPQ